MSVQYKLEKFEGPLDLLLHLIDKSEIDIYDIPVKEITEQYMGYLKQMEKFELEITSEFLVMAATLLSIKSKMLLPKPPPIDLELDEEDMEDPREELVRKLIEYRKYKSIADHLRDQELERSLIYSKEPDDLSHFISETVENPVEGLHLADLIIAFSKVIKKVERRQSVATIRRDEISVKDRILEMIGFFKQSESKVLFSTLFKNDVNRDFIIVTFLGLLELMKMKKIICYQHGSFDDIVIEYIDKEEAHELNTDEIDY
ncbi:segregation and condensation protein A [Chengkuizengella axinellae]|uniref:Segregation and condensation protein A n=1 Tax=Chengkuizengella axinellae TaxID=3064388 RepID=A0ABT9IY68_9BACL|nr:segregation/condensation protein A [Chengkuizengella sp. 2205SS18-9]MDP5273750.1 segregation/condensation protein A [Chengkuizengella sp. 2205SS18-9]